MDIEKRISTIQADHDALVKRRTGLLSQAERIRDEISKINEEVLRCQGAYQILSELKEEGSAAEKIPAPTSDGCPVGGAGKGD
jgi:prefoldin subunit 5